MDGAGALVGGDVGGVGAEDGAVEEGVLEGDAVELAALEEGDDVDGLGRGLGWIRARSSRRAVNDDLGEQRLGDDVNRVGRGEGDVFHLWVEGHRERRG